MNRTARISLIGLVLLGLAAGLFGGDESHERTATTFGRIPRGFGAIYDLLAELKLPVRRNHASPAHLPAQSTVWWIEPGGLCTASAKPVSRRHAPAAWSGSEWIRSGGTAVVFLSRLDERCGAIAGQALPRRTGDMAVAGKLNGEPPADEPPDRSRRWWEIDVERWFPPGVERTIEGPLSAQPRIVMSEESFAFDGAGKWTVVASIAGKPFALEQKLGSGRLVVFADAGFLSNGWIAHHDAAPLVLDIVRAYGVPLFDERSHGFLEHENSFAYLLASPAAAVFAALILLGLLFAAHGRMLPERTVQEVDLAAPTLETFVDSLATLYSRTRDVGRVFECYRDLTLRRLRRHFGLPPETAPHIVIERLRATRRMDTAALAGLARPSRVGSENELRRAAAELDAAVWEASRG